MRKILIFLITAVLLISEAGGFVRPLTAAAGPDTSQNGNAGGSSSGSGDQTDDPGLVEPETQISWSDDMGGERGAQYTPYGYWWNDAVSDKTGTDYHGRLGNEGGSVDGYTYYYLKGYKFKDLVMEFDVEAMGRKSQYGVVVRASDPGPGTDQGNGYTVMYNGSWVFVGRLSGSFTQVTETQSAYAYNPTDHGVTLTHWKVVCSGKHLAVYFNGSSEPAIHVTDSVYESGQVGFRAFSPAGSSSNVVIDNLTVRGTGEMTDTPMQPVEPGDPYEIEEPEAQISWADDMESENGGAYTPYGIWWNDAVSDRTEENYGGVLANEGGPADGITYYYLNEYKFKDLVAEFEVAEMASGASYGVVLRAGDPGPGADQGNGYTVMYDGAWVFAGKLDGSFTQLTDTPAAYAFNPSDHGMTLTHWKVVCVGDTIAVYFNGGENPAIVVKDSSFTEGLFGIRAFAPAGTARSVVLDDLFVWGTGEITQDVPTPEPPEPFEIREPETQISWSDDMNADRGGSYTPYGIWWNDSVSDRTGENYRGVLSNEGGPSDGITYYYLNGYTFEDLVMEFDVTDMAPGANYGVVLRAGKPGPEPDGAMGYTVMYNGEWVFAGKMDGSFTQLTDTPSVYAYNPADHGLTLTHWKVVCVGDTIAVYFNSSDSPAMIVRDGTFKAGSVGIRGFAPANTPRCFVIDNLTVRGTGTYKKPKGLNIRSYDLDTEKFEWKDDFEGSSYTAYLAYGRWWNNVKSESNGETYSGVVANEGGIGDGICYYYLRKYKWADFTMEFDVSKVHRTAQYGVVLRAGKYTPGADDCDGYTVMYDGSWMFVGRLDGKFRQVKSDVSPYAYNPKDHGITPRHWKITFKGNLLCVYLNGSDKPVIKVTDNAFQCGYVGFRTFAKMGSQTNIFYDNLRISGTVVKQAQTTTLSSNRGSGQYVDYSQMPEGVKHMNKVVTNEEQGGSDEPVVTPDQGQTEPASQAPSEAASEAAESSGKKIPKYVIPLVIGGFLTVAAAETAVLLIRRKKKNRSEGGDR